MNPPVDLPVVSTGFTGKPLQALKPYEHWTVDELKSEGFEEVIWDGKSVIPPTTLTPFVLTSRLLELLALSSTGKSVSLVSSPGAPFMLMTGI